MSSSATKSRSANKAGCCCPAPACSNAARRMGRKGLLALLLALVVSLYMSCRTEKATSRCKGRDDERVVESPSIRTIIIHAGIDTHGIPHIAPTCARVSSWSCSRMQSPQPSRNWSCFTNCRWNAARLVSMGLPSSCFVDADGDDDEVRRLHGCSRGERIVFDRSIDSVRLARTLRTPSNATSSD